MPTSRIYVVSDTDAKELIRATSKAQAVRHFVAGRVSAEVASQDDIIELVGSGAKVSDATENGDG